MKSMFNTMKLVSYIALTSFASVALSASCDSVLQAGIYNISKSTSATDAQSMMKSTFCSADYSKIEKSSSQAGGIKAAYGVFSASGNSAASDVDIQTKQSEVCTSGFNSSSYNSQVSDSAKIIYQGSLNAWNRCLEVKAKGVDLETFMDPEANGATVTLSANTVGAFEFRGLVLTGDGRVECTTVRPDDGARKTISVDRETRFNFDASSRPSIVCNRIFDIDKSGNKFSNPVTLWFDTNAGIFQVPLGRAGYLANSSIEAATKAIGDEVRLKVKEDIKTDLNAIKKENSAALNVQAHAVSQSIEAAKNEVLNSARGIRVDVAIADLKQLHGSCNGTNYQADHAPCIYAAMRWCNANSYNIGLIESWGPTHLNVACIR